MIYEYKGIRPRFGRDVFLAPGVVVLGDVEIGDCTNIWFNTVVRGDVNIVRIGTQTNIQDLCMLHVTSDRFPLIMGHRVIVGHRAVLHGCTIHDDVLIGIGALVLDGVVVEQGATVAAGAVVPPGTVIPADSVAMGAPAKVRRATSPEEKAFHQVNLARYQEYGLNFAQWVREVPPDYSPR
jgi:carbonic anhydrase/acetyltransferase-like protein (isoleucine patch superfamily)